MKWIWKKKQVSLISIISFVSLGLLSEFSKVLFGMPWCSWMIYCYKLAVFLQMPIQEMLRRSSVLFWKDLLLYPLRLCLDADECSVF